MGVCHSQLSLCRCYPLVNLVGSNNGAQGSGPHMTPGSVVGIRDTPGDHDGDDCHVPDTEAQSKSLGKHGRRHHRNCRCSPANHLCPNPLLPILCSHRSRLYFADRLEHFSRRCRPQRPPRTRTGRHLHPLGQALVTSRNH